MTHSIYITLRTTLFLIVFLVLNGCGANFSARNTDAMVEDNQAPERYCILLCLRQAGYAGQGRTHILGIDDRSIGMLTPDNYYRIELWPGSYTFTVCLPEETFLGETRRALSISKRILLEPRDAGHVFVLQYTDGMTASSFSFTPAVAVAPVLAGRALAGSIGLHDTAKVLELFDARYEGPSRHGKAHGWGTLTWPDGCVYQGMIEYGEPTTQGRFYFPQGEYFRGLFRKGRPYQSGLLFAQDGGIVFAGRFVDEKPHGQGIRLGSDGPEFCVYDHGEDITKTEQAREALDKVEAEQDDALLAHVISVENQLKQAIAREREWCQGEFARGRRWCQCAPFADDYLNWADCLPR